MVFFKHQRSLVKNGDSHIFDNAVGLNIAEVGDFALDAFILNFFITAKNNYIGRNSVCLQLLNRVLSRLGFVLARSVKIGHKGNMNIKRVFSADFKTDLPYRLKKRLALNVADGSADFRYNDVSVCLFAHAVNEIFNFICNMGDYLNGFAEIFALSLFVDNP